MEATVLVHDSILGLRVKFRLSRVTPNARLMHGLQEWGLRMRTRISRQNGGGRSRGGRCMNLLQPLVYFCVRPLHL